MLVFSGLSHAQSIDWCATPDSTTSTNYPQSTDPAYFDTQPPKLYNVVFRPIYGQEGYFDETGQSFVSEEDALIATANLNREFNQFNIFFKYRGVEPIINQDFVYVSLGVNNDYLDCPPSNYGDYSSFTVSNAISNHLNIYIPLNGCGFSGSYSPDNSIATVRYPRLKEYHLLHEIGHIFGLGHAWSGYTNTGQDSDGTWRCERVTRDVTQLDEYNADRKGDDVKDTAAIPKFNRPHNGLNNNVNANCVYVGIGEDCGMSLYNIPPDEKGTLNFMSNGSECPTSGLDPGKTGFSIGQGVRMRGKINDPALATFFAAFEESDFSSLYQPYRGEYAEVYYPYSSIERPLFQPGFDYKFVKCYGDYPQPSNYNEAFNYDGQQVIKDIDKFESDFSAIYHPDGTAVRIVQLDNVIGLNPQSCFNTDWFATKGLTKRFHDNQVNNNYTITIKDEQEISDPNLIDDLAPGLYVIEKEYEDGSIEQTVILKDNE